MAQINCPMCGKPNPAGLEVCQFCEARLKPVTDELSRSQPPIRPGEQPQELDTGQLEPVLPKWLRDIRQQARESEQEEPAPSSKKKEEEAKKKTVEKGDLLAGLSSKAEEDEEIPDWLAGLRGEGGKASFEEKSPADDDDMAALRSMFGEGAPVPPKEEDNSLPDWAAGLNAPEPQSPAQAEPEPPASGSDFRWDADFGAESTEGENAFDTGLPAWMRGEEPPASEAESKPLVDQGDLPAWLQDEGKSPKDEEADTGLPAWMRGVEPAPPEPSAGTPAGGETDLSDWLASLSAEDTDQSIPSQPAEPSEPKSTTDWLSSLGKEETSAPPPEPPESAIKSTTDWLASLGQETYEPAPPPEAPGQAEEGSMPDWLAGLGEGSSEAIPTESESPSGQVETPDWLSSLGAETPQEVSPQEAEEAESAGPLPDWLAALGQESSEAFPPESGGPSGQVETPDWLSSLSQSSMEEVPPQEEKFEEPAPSAPEAGLMGWLSTLDRTAAEGEPPVEEQGSAISEPMLPAEETGQKPAYMEEEDKSISKEDVDAIFSMDMPDWLSESRATPEEGPTLAPAEDEADELRPADLPSWVQAMRPVESVITETQGAAVEDQPMEERGPLAGLRGVLPAVPGVGLSSKPKSYSIKLLASEDQQSNAAMLEKMLAEELNPVAISTPKAATQRLLRLVITVLFLSVVGLIFFSGTRINPISTSVPLETKSVLDYVQNTLPANAPVLLVFDYQAARAGELEVAAAPLVDQMLTLKAPRLTLVSSTPVGTGLSERFMQIVLTDRAYARDEKFVNLGYLPGGAAGVQAFASNAAATKPLTTTGTDAWTTPALQDVTGLSQFAAIFLLTDDIDNARVWIEQTESNRREVRLLVVSSAQSGPMIKPYVNAGQVDGMITGLDSSAPIEQANSGRPGMARRYWDAYGFGLLTAVALIVIGALWSLVSNWQAFRKEQREG